MKTHSHHQNETIRQEESAENFDSFNPSLETINLFSSELPLNENDPYNNQFPNLNYQIYNQKSEEGAWIKSQ